MSETSALTEAYNEMKLLACRGNCNVYCDDNVNMGSERLPVDQVNYINDGGLVNERVDLAINEFDKSLRGLLNFQNINLFKCLITKSGLEQVRSTLAYQKMQKHTLIAACRSNSDIMHKRMRAINELDIFV